jgi:hypothetical protein
MIALYEFIQSNLVQQKYQHIEDLLNECSPEDWASIWKTSLVVAKRKVANSDKLIFRDLNRTADYFKVQHDEIIKLASFIDNRPRKPSATDVLDWRVYTLHRMMYFLDRYLSLAKEDYKPKSENDRRRVCLHAVDDLLRKFD